MSSRELRSICVFCGSRPGADSAFVQSGDAMGRAIAARGLTLVYGGARIGVMGAVANGALAAGGRVVGVIPKSLVSREVAHDGLAELFLTDTMHDRKDRMILLSDAFIALPGGLGTLDEVFETMTLAQIGIQEKPTGLLDVNGFFEPLLALVRHTIATDFALARDEQLLVFDRDPERLLDGLVAWRPPPPATKIARAKSEIS